MVKLDPDEGRHDTLTTSPLLSFAIGVSHSTSVAGCPMSGSTVRLIGQNINSGFSLSVRSYMESAVLTMYKYIGLGFSLKINCNC